MTQIDRNLALSVAAAVAMALGAAGDASAGLISSQAPGITIAASAAAEARAAEDAFKAGLDRFTTQSFETIAKGEYDRLETEVGTLTAVTAGRRGKAFSVAEGNVSGRILSGRFLESRDLVALSWNVDVGGDRFNSIGFYIQDPADQGAAFRLTFADGTAEFAFLDFTQLANRDLYYITVLFDAPLTAATVDLVNINGVRGDGWGIDDLTVGLQVPEPPALGVLGAALATLALGRRWRGRLLGSPAA